MNTIDAAAQNASAGDSDLGVELPTDPRLWLNSAPLSMESLKGKGVIFYFFEEECPTCARGWDDVQSLAATYQDKPLLFVAVNSGTKPHELSRYIRRNKVEMPVIQDPYRYLESSMGVPELSLNGSVLALRYVDGEGNQGEIRGAGGAAFRNAAQSALKGAAWRVDPNGLPNQLRDAWRAIELGDFAAAARPVTRAAKAKEGPLKEGAERLLTAVAEEASTALEEASEALGEGKSWAAYQAYSSITERFAGYELTAVKESKEQVKKLAKSEEIKNELTAAKLLDRALASESVSKLKRVSSRYPSTQAGARAATMLASMGR